MNRSEVFVDTSAFYALYSAVDEHHGEAHAALKNLRDERAVLVTSGTVILESCVLFHARVGREGLLRFHRATDASRWLRILVVTPEWEGKAWEMIETHTDKDWSYIDATSFVLMRSTDVRRAFTFDEHFAQAGFEMVPGTSRPRRQR